MDMVRQRPLFTTTMSNNNSNPSLMMSDGEVDSHRDRRRSQQAALNSSSSSTGNKEAKHHSLPQQQQQLPIQLSTEEFSSDAFLFAAAASNTPTPHAFGGEDEARSPPGAQRYNFSSNSLGDFDDSKFYSGGTSGMMEGYSNINKMPGGDEDFEGGEEDNEDRDDGTNSSFLDQPQHQLLLQRPFAFLKEDEDDEDSGEDQQQLDTSPLVTPPALISHSQSSKKTTPATQSTTTIFSTVTVTTTPVGVGPKKRQPLNVNKSSNIGSTDPLRYNPSHLIVTGVPHVYHDHSQLPDDSSFTRKKTGGVTQPFPEKLQEMLRSVAETKGTAIVSWLPHGRAFLVRKPKEFTEIIMPKYFKQTKLTSFQRQLNLYGFRRLTQGADAGAYYHEMFLQARPGLCQRMARQKVKGTGHKQPADAKTEPNFYEMRPADPSAVVAPQSTLLLSPPQQQQSRTYEALGSGPGTVSGSSPSPAWTLRQPPPGSVLDSPASPGLHGAAHLLQNIASGGYSNSTLQMPRDILLGPPAVATREIDDENKGTGDDPSSENSANDNARSASFLQPRLSWPLEKR